ncbi:MAG: response regulator [Spirochaetaceae bacterium]|nr:response regulator [Spirochaetaceae bacterium]RKX85182.1 MAG: hypothetical protein DRP70_12075 [Spirochaetota bacterium]RKX95615.1 MAG: hypothetical protein DRZ90_10020 [Spirochaetota bacterium]
MTNEIPDNDRGNDAELIQSRKMETLGRLVGGVAHDFNNMLMVIQGFSDFLKLSFTSEAPEKRYLDEILTAADRAASLTQQLMDFSRKQISNPEVMELDNIVASSSRLFERIIGEDVQMTVELQSDSACIKADRTGIVQILTNLVMNAREAMPDGGTLLIETARVQNPSPELPRGPYVRLTVADSGCGIADKVLPKIYEPFYTTKEEGAGTGLGLTIALEAVKQAGGSLICESEMGVGTKFSIDIPIFNDDSAGLSPEDKILRNLGRGEKLLVVEDDPSVRAFLSELLSVRGYNITVAENGERAWEYFQESIEPFDLILTDIIMPKLGGQELVSKIIQSGRKVPHIVFLSGYMQDATSRLAEISIPWTFIGKPVQPPQLLSRLRDILDKHSESGD